ncbi:cAMP-binding domain of CRP or a regulatory subunit of cAMP-dependent protein kinases [Chitinophaga terrae (ex Kim and Jung 2007)]|uniref:cAMP-binding domain of CRP or a regulatory subunit of cAMP-dependent protein kinases n=1 Tax=Chitinophaga terrae (ex Kim and Jung 2007) TaxID=408074 RepID=A0A1H4F9P8_9BACT|nr:Crp/Fnr family transcriptional regulator [Chitinophaga terrae (ex Kim and Jung 2007)]GEP92284.1 cyclic nucleotide-binding protein [Chitinophaga terrae (ex Kim and Jung 2007)]SEA94066.1 cAMP-binding domain of CRP or a regulatory subunit of cAMP-dependent protein kinases [Chitinophaga terrae (ex Kim and Jung 2007)]
MSLDLLHKTANAIMPLPATEWEALAACWTPVKFKRKEIITPTGEIEKYLYFVVKGVQRVFSLDGEKETTLIFSYTGSFSGIMDSFQLQKPSPWYLEALTHSEMLRLNFADFVRLTDEYPLLQKWVRIGSVAALSGVLERYNELIAFTAEQKFRKLLTRSPHVLQLIPHKYLASYLGIDPATFSKLLSTVKL